MRSVRRTDNQRKLTSMRAAKSIPTLSEKDKSRFFAKISTIPTERGCLDWTASKGNGYGRFRIGGSKFKANRVAYFLHHGVDPGELDVCHSCDRPSCANPAHFFLDTHAGNMRDMMKKGRCNSPRGDAHGSRLHPERMARGEAQGCAKLKASDIPIIRADGRAQHKIAADYGVSQVAISLIKRRKNWSHIQ